MKIRVNGEEKTIQSNKENISLTETISILGYSSNMRDPLKFLSDLINE